MATFCDEHKTSCVCFFLKLISLIHLDRETKRNQSLACYNTCLLGTPSKLRTLCSGNYELRQSTTPNPTRTTVKNFWRRVVCLSFAFFRVEQNALELINWLLWKNYIICFNFEVTILCVELEIKRRWKIKIFSPLTLSSVLEFESS